MVSLLFLSQESSHETSVICKKMVTLALAISVPLSEFDVLLSGLFFICIVLVRTWGLEEEIERKGYREGAEKECREHDLGLKCVSLLVQAPCKKQVKMVGKELLCK